MIGAVIPFRLVIDLGQDSVGSILQIIASSMLAVTTFSLTTMVTAYSSATTTATPRATQLLVQDRTSQNALSTFVGAFTFSLVGIIALSTAYYSDQGRTILFFGTLVVIAVIVVTLLRWIGHLTTFGRMSDVIDRVETAAGDTLHAYATSPTLGARRARAEDLAGHSAAVADTHGARVRGEETGYVTHIDIAALNRIGEDTDADLRVLTMPGTVVDPTTPLVHTRGHLDEGARTAVRRAFTVARHRDYDQDPRLGVIALAEIASRALSPSTNDPGTAIEVIASLQRVFVRTLTTTPDDDVRYLRVLVEPVALQDLITDAFRPIARDGAGMVEVQIRLQKCLGSLARVAPGQAHLFRAAAERALTRVDAALTAEDAAAVHHAHDTHL
ncbi:DUF2254 domain-containing protein [Cnuibacter physcomitrellae]|uniref:DUF2254 domain-containing protein n=1 Tax=Cnuibacter physcomitrellae TaxID=1619308 RepID=UPI00157C1292|nr:DUF2254 domain-containing protein [Cnuibacter physcomitrellae]